jgi:hypothetical protein
MGTSKPTRLLWTRLEQYGSALDLEARERARAVLQELLSMLDRPRPIGIGHNNPPEDIDEAEAFDTIRTEVAALHVEFGKPNPSISLVKKLGVALGRAALASIKWTGRKIDLAIDTAIKSTIPTVALVIGATYNDEIHKAIDVVRTWLEIVAHKLSPMKLIDCHDCGNPV